MADVKISSLPASTTPLAGTEVLPVVQGGVTKKVAVSDLTAGRAVSATQYTSTIPTGTAPLVVVSTTEVANLKAATATLADTATSANQANAVKSNATTGLMQIAGPATGQTRVVTIPDANATMARTDAAQTFTGDQTLSTGNLVIGTSGKGIDFSATPGTGTSELFADYEEGTWTPIAVGTVTAGTCTYVFNTGSYTKVGRLVYFQMELFYTTHTGTGNLQIKGLPFTVDTTGTAICNPSGLVFSNNLVITATSGTTSLVPFTYASDVSRTFFTNG